MGTRKERNITSIQVGFMLILSLLGGCFQADDNQMDQYDPRVAELLARMTLEEKVGQMTQVTIETVLQGESVIQVEHPIKIDTSKLRRMVVDYKVGSILNSGGEAISLELWESINRTIQEMAQSETPNGVPVLYGIDAVHGSNFTLGATLFPHQIGLAATWNPDLVQRLYSISAYETRASNIPWSFAPSLDLGIDPRWARQWEGFGEDPYLVSVLGVAAIRGIQGNDVSHPESLGATMKHYIGYGAPRSGKDGTPAWIPERQLRELFVPPFKAAIEAGVKTVMINSGEVNGVPVHASPQLLTTLLREELGFKGPAISDWSDIYNLVDRHRIAHDEKEATKMAVNAGIDMAMVPYDIRFADHLIELVREGEVNMKRINEAVARILQLKYELGLFDKPAWDHEEYQKFGSQEFQDVSYQGALESITLLKNEEDVLPLKKGQKVLVTGPNANSMRTLNGGWTYSWQGEKTDEIGAGYNTILEAVGNKIGSEHVTYVEGLRYPIGATYDIDEMVDIKAVVTAAAFVDVVIVCVGENSYTGKLGDLNDLNLSSNQKRLVKELAIIGKPIVLVLNQGRPRVIDDIEPLVQGIVNIYLPGNQGANALVDVIFGDANPSGRLPFTYPRNANDLVTNYHKNSEAVVRTTDMPHKDLLINPQYPFGHGLGYTTFDYTNLHLASNEVAPDDTLRITVNLKNSGDMNGAEVIQVYSSDLVATVTPHVKRLRAFKKVILQAGLMATYEFAIPVRDLAFVNRQNNWAVEKGQFLIQINNLTDTINVTRNRVFYRNINLDL